MARWYGSVCVLFCFLLIGFDAASGDAGGVANAVVVMVSQRGAGGWPSAETRIREELAFSNLEVVTLDGGVAEGADIVATLPAIAERYRAATVVVIDRNDTHRVSVTLLEVDIAGRSPSVKNITIIIPSDRSEEEAVEIVAFKTMEAVLVSQLHAASSSEGPTPAAAVSETPKISVNIVEGKFDTGPKQTLRTGAIACLISGSLTLATGGVLHTRKLTHESRALETYHDNKNSETWTPEYADAFDKWERERRRSEGNRIGAIAAYTVGGALVVTAASLFVFAAHRKSQEKGFVTVQAAPSGLIVNGTF